ncbi:MAG: carbonic anhydrase family protein [Haemophilus parainfluenzae]
MQASVAQENAPSITLDGKQFYLKQFHFHTPSEHTFKRKHYPLEIHFVHQSEDKSLAVIAVMVNEGEANPALAPVVEKNSPLDKKKNWLNRLIFKH